MKKIKSVEDLSFDEKNFNMGNEYGKSLIKKSLKDYGAGRSILIDKNGKIIAGNKTTENFIELGNKEIEVIKSDGSKLIVVQRDDVDLNTPEGRAMALADNRTSEANLEWNISVMQDELPHELLMDFGIQNLEEPEVTEDDYEEPDDLQVDVVLGDLIEIGEHRLLCGDSTKISDLKRLMNDKLGDLIIIDPPYNVDYEGGTKDKLKIKNDSMGDDEFYSFLLKSFTNLYEYTKPGGVWYVWHSDTQGANFRFAFSKSGMLLKQCLIWNKSSIVMGRQDYHWKHEPCLYGWKPGASHSWFSDRKQSTILEFDRPNVNDIHPTMKPVGLISYLIQNNSKRKEIIVDTFLGSGSTMVASHQLKRRCYGMELDPKYCQVIIDRMKKLDESLEIKINGEIYKNG